MSYSHSTALQLLANLRGQAVDVLPKPTLLAMAYEYFALTFVEFQFKLYTKFTKIFAKIIKGKFQENESTNMEIVQQISHQANLIKFHTVSFKW